MTELSHRDILSKTPSGLIVVSPDVDPSTLDINHINTLLEAATMSAIDGALHSGTDVPVGAAASRDGEILSINYAQDNRIHDPNAHAEYMTMELARQKYPGVSPDMIAVTLEPCKMCQNYLAEFPDLKVVAFALPLASAALRNVVRPKECTIFDRHERDPLPYSILQVGNERLSRLGELLLDITSRDIETGETSIDATQLRNGLSGLI